ncbi:GNAT family N-acetyltransferase [Propionicicella superfundia]|uniref:GNAT family N-acetyltransferase n=1 Tax=Propionicicella superfundia TaxID=348582 RepID=UPI00041BFF68|nr:GNAT family N-acetyltransferase [Propionicicella superfundia]
MLRPATDSDSADVLRWRNHPDVRAVSLTQHVIGTAEHTAWWERTMVDPTRRVLIYERAGAPAGVVTFFDIDAAAHTAWWGYYLDNEGLTAAGALFPAWIQIQRDAVKYARDVLGLRELHAETLGSNDSVRQVNSRQGFEEVETTRREIGGRTVDVIHTVKRFEEGA